MWSRDGVTAVVDVDRLRMRGLVGTVLAGSRRRHVPRARDGATLFTTPLKAHGHRREACRVEDATGHSFGHFPDVAGTVSGGAEV